VPTDWNPSQKASSIATGGRAGQQRPLALYTNRDCCTLVGTSKLNARFVAWEGLPVWLVV